MRNAKKLGGAIALLVASASPALAVPRLTEGPADYVLMPFLGYAALLGVAQLIGALSRKGGR